MLTSVKKTTLALIFFLFFSCTINAQWVTIPDQNFLTYLQQNYPGCISGNLMDTTCNGILSDTSITLTSTPSVQNFEGIQYFDGLKWLDISANNPGTVIPKFPQNLTTFLCMYNGITSLPPFPASLIYCFCSHNNLTNLPALPNNLNNIYCEYNNLTSLPALPASIQYFQCDNNQISSLPPLPAGLLTLHCQNNQLTSLPSLPPLLSELICGSNQLSSLPSLPSTLYRLECDTNQITCIPSLPYTLTNSFTLNLDGNPFTCLPNYVSAMNGTGYLNYPLCSSTDTLNNPNGCPAFKSVNGFCYHDATSNCILDGNDGLLKNIPMKLKNNAGATLAKFYSLSNGGYNYVLDTATYTVSIDSVATPYTVNCLYPGLDSTFTLTNINPLAEGINFDVKCKAGFDIGVKSVNPLRSIFPGLPHRTNIAAGDLSKWHNLNCASGVAGNIVVTINGPVTFDSIPSNSLTPTTITGNTFTYSIADFGSVNLNSFAMWFTTDTSAQIGDQICVNVNVTPTAGDNNTANNSYTFCYIVGNSYDPNNKQVYPTTVNPAYNGYFTYTINFQNVGNAPAQNIRVLDTLANNLDLNTFEIINYSHANTSMLTGNVAMFRFPNIQLADSASNPEGSKGFIQYRIKPIANLPLGTQIKNKARIYFDFNAPILTNTAVSNFTSTVGLTPNHSPQEKGVMVYPNPGKGVFNLRFSDNSTSLKAIEVFNMIGEKVFSGIAKTGNAVVDLRTQPNGVYVLRVSDDVNVFVQRIIKQ